MANPRKFSEKIALHAQKQAEETAAFEQIMREVGVAVPKGPLGVSPVAAQAAFMSQSLLQPFHRGCGGSLPNVNQMVGFPMAHPQPAYQEVVGMSQGTPPGYSVDPRGSGIGPQRIPRAACDHRRETSPYSPPGPCLLSPPSDTGWRRTHSDSALHRTLQTAESYSPVLQRREGGGGVHEVPGSGGSSPAPPPGHWNPFDPKLGHVPVAGPHQASDQRVPGAPGMRADGRPPPLNGIPPAGSLPDLTPAEFAAPAPPRDADDLKRTPPYSSPVSPVYGAPPSPGHSQHQPPHSIPGPTPSRNHLYVPHGSQSPSYLSPLKAAAVDPRSPGLSRKSPFPYGDPQQHSPPCSQQQQQPVSPDPLLDMMAYRSPQLSPRSVSPLSFNQPGYRSPSPLEGILSAPSSPAAPASVSNNGFYTAPHAHQMQQQFEQFSMGISPVSAQTMLTSSERSQQTTPLTPTSSIPEITLSDFSCASGELAAQHQDLLQDMRDASELLQGATADTFDAEDLGELDLEGLQMLTNPDGHVIDATSEDYLRMESLGP